MVEKRFRALRAIGNISKVLGIVTVAAGVVMAILSLVFIATHRFGDTLFNPLYGPRMMAGGGVLGALGALLWAAIVGLAFYGLGEIIFLLIAVEENTRASMEYLRRQQENTGQAAGAAAIPPDAGATP